MKAKTLIYGLPKYIFKPENEKISFINKNLILTTNKIEIGKYKNGIFSIELEYSFFVKKIT